MPLHGGAARTIDWAEVDRRSRSYENDRAAREFEREGAVFSSEAVRLVESAQAVIGRRPPWWRRISLPFAPSASERTGLARAQEDLRRAAALLEEGASRAERYLALLEEGSSRDPRQAALQARVRSTRVELLSREREARSLVTDAEEDLALRSGGFIARIRHSLRRLSWRDAETKLETLRAELWRWDAARPPPVLGAQLTYVQGALTPAPLPKTSITPAYLAGDSAAIVLEDTTQGREVELSPDITAKAQELGSPKASCDFVKNQMRLDWYFGSLKGSTETLREARGNDADLAALLIALLRAQGTSARYVRGTVELPVAKLAELMGLLSEAEVSALYSAPSAFTLDPGARDKAFAALSGAGIPFEPVVVGGQATGVRFLHTWVEAHIPYADYRGVGGGRGGRVWVPMDPSIPGAGKYAARAPALDAFGQLGASAPDLMAAYLGQTTSTSPLEYTRAGLQDLLTASGSSLPYSDLLRTIAQRSETLPFIPGTLPYRVVSVHDEGAFLPDEFKHRVHFSASDGAGEFLDATLPLHQLVGHRTVFTYKPASDADADAISLAGGVYQAPAAAIGMTAVVRVDGQEKAAASRSVGLGADHEWSMELLLPDGSARRIDNRVIAGNLVAIAFGGPTNGYVEAPPTEGSDLDGPAPRFLYGRAAAYANAWTESEEELARLLGVVPVRPTASVVLVENQLAVDEVLGVRRRVLWKGLEVDADHRSMIPLELVSGRGRELMLLSGYQGSFLEAKVLTDGTGERAVSAVSVIQQAHDAVVPVLSITQSNATTQLPLLSASPDILQDVEDQIARGREVLIPARSQTIEAWTGTGYIARAPGTDEGGYFLSGVISGAQTVASPDSWQDAALAQLLQQPAAPPATNDTCLAARIIKVPASDLQQVVVGNSFDKPLAVFVTTERGIPVRGASVTFRSIAGSKPTFFAPNSPTQRAETVTVTTDAAGRAAVQAWPDTSITSYFVTRDGTPNKQLVGLNVITAETTPTPSGACASGNAIVLAEPFRETALPDAPAKVKLLDQTAFTAPLDMILGQDLPATVQDRYGNPLANEVVQWTQAPDTGRFVDPASRSSNQVMVLDPGDAAQVPVLVQTSSTLGTVVVDYINGGGNSITARCGTASSSYTIAAYSDESLKYVFGWIPSARTSFDGIYRSSFPQPYAFQILRRSTGSGSAWVPLRGDEPELRSASISMVVSDGTRVLDRQTATPLAVGAGPTSGIDTDTNAVFWPRYLVMNGQERLDFSAEVLLADGTRDCCSSTFTFTQLSSSVPIDLERVLPGRVYQPADALGAVSSGDVALSFAVTNRASYPIYARVTQQATVAGEALVFVPPPDAAPRYPSAPDLIQLPEYGRTHLTLDLVPGSHGGTVDLEVLAPDPAMGPTALVTVGVTRMTVPAQESGITAPDELATQIILPVRNLESTATPAPPAVVPAGSTEPPIIVPARLDFVVKGSGRVSVASGSTVLSVADFVTDAQGALAVRAVAGEPPPPTLTAQGALRVPVYPMSEQYAVGGQRVSIQVTVPGATTSETREIPVKNEVLDLGALPVGHTFVKDVSVVDGHLTKQAVDLSVPGRGGGLSLARSYTSRGFEASPLGQGWTHSYRSYVIADPLSVGFTDDGETAPGGSGNRFVVVGGEGTGQVFTCTGATPTCAAQRGYHGTLTIQSSGGSQELVYTSRTGVAYRYASLNTAVWPYRYPLQSITYPTGHRTDFEYSGAESDHEVNRVFEPGHRRYLQFFYERPAGAKRARLARVELVLSPVGAEPTPQAPGTTLACLAYGYDAKDNLASAARYDGRCGASAAVRVEGYGYVESHVPALENNLASYIDADGVLTRYEWYAESDSVPGEGQFLLMGDKAERVKSVIEPSPGGTTRFTYSLVQSTVTVFGRPVIAYATRVASARPEVSRETVYWMDPYGGTSRVERPLSAGVTAVSSTTWDPTHQRPASEEDARGRQTSYAYDARGNLVERRISTPVLPASGEGGPTMLPTDGAGAPVAEVVEKWSYDPLFGGVTCHVDPAGRLTVTTYDMAAGATGLPIAVHRYASQVAANALASGPSCNALAAAVTASANDIVTRRTYCGVNGTCSAGFQKGDLVTAVDGEENTSRVLGYDAHGNPTRTQVSPATGSTIATDSAYDDRSRLESQSDTVGHSLVRRYDGLDRVIYEKRDNTKGGSPAVVKTLAYWPGGQPRQETNGLGLTRTTTLDGMGRPWQIVEKGPGLPGAGLTTTVVYDEAGNRTDVTDRRGVRTHTVYDWGDRPLQVSVAIADAATFAAQGGDPAAVGQGGVIATYGYDAAGNKVFEPDLHGHRTDYQLDSLYRVVGVTSPAVPGATIGAGPVRYTTTRRFDLAGNKAYEVDGNGHATTWTYDFADRVTKTTDAVGRVERRGYDRNGNLVSLGQEAPEGTVHLERTTAYDGLNRPLAMTEGVPGLSGTTTYRQQTVYDDANHLVATSDRRGYVTTRSVDDLDRVFTEVVDDDSGLISRPSGGPAALNLTIQYQYDAAGNRKLTIDPLGRRTEEVHDTLGRLTHRNLPMGVSEALAYDGEGHVISTTDRRGVERRTRYDAVGRPTVELLVESLSAGGVPLAMVTRTYGDVPADGSGLVSVTEVDARGSTTARWLDGLHREVRTVDAVAKAVQTAYDAVNRTAVQDRRGYLTTFQYDAANRLIGQQDHDGNAVAYSQSTSYDDATRRQTGLDRRQIATVAERDGLGRVVQVTRGSDPDVQVTATGYDGNGNVVRVTDPNGHVLAASFDGANRRISETRGYGSAVAATTTFKYDGTGNRTEAKSARVTGVSYDLRESYDDLDRSVRSEDALGNVTTRAFDAAGNKLCEKRPLGNATGAAFGHGQASGLTVDSLVAAVCAGDHLTRYAYDELSKLKGVIDAAGGVTTFVYDRARNLIAKQDANEHLTTYWIDPLGRRRGEYQHLDAHARMTAASRDAIPQDEGLGDPVAGTGTLAWLHEYDDSGNLVRTTDPKLQVLTMTYGVLDRLQTKSWLNRAAPLELPSLGSVSYVYDGNGNLTQVSEQKDTATGSVTEVTGRVFDGLDRLETETRYDGKVVSYEYDAKGNRTKVTDPDQVPTAYTYDALDRLETAAAGGGTTSYGYWPDSLLKRTTLPNGVAEGRCYDPAGELTELVTARGTVDDGCATSGQAISSYSYEYDADGNRIHQEEQRTDPSTQVLGAVEDTRYAYDALDRLTGALYPGGRAVLYALDPVGNRIGERGYTGVTTSDVQLVSYTSPPQATLVRDVTGTFNRVDWLVSRTDAVDPSKSVTYQYDRNGNVRSKATGTTYRTLAWDARNTLTAVFDNGTEVGRYDYDRGLQRVKRKTAQENVEYVLDDRFVLQEASGSDSTHPSYRRYHYGKEPLAVADSGQNLRFLSVDALGSVSDFTTTGGTLYQARQYDAWGQYRNGTAPAANQPKLGYTGHQFDPETGLVYARARYYDAETGVFLSRDTYEGELDDAPSLHRYVYAKDNPTTYRDEHGRSATVGFGVAGFFWGFGQMVGGMAQDVMDGKVRDTSEYLGVWGQNFVAGIELGASIDVCAVSGGLAASACGALAMAGFDALTFGGRGKSADEFAKGQLVEGVKGAVLGPVVSRVAPYVGKVGGAILRQAEKVPGVQFVEEKAVQAVGNLAKKATDSFVIAEADQQTIQVADRAIGRVGQELSEFGRKALTDELGAAGDVGAVRRALSRESAVPPRAPDAVPPDAVPEGSFSIVDWSGYPEGVARPTGPFRLLPDEEYEVSRRAANAANQAYRQTSPDITRAQQVHELHPVKFGGHPTDPANKVVVDYDPTHKALNRFWRRLQGYVEEHSR